MVAQLLVERIELLARSCAHDAGDAQVGALAARPHLDRGSVEIRRVPEDDADHHLREARPFAAHDLDRKIAWEGERRAAFGLRLVQADTGSRLPALMTFCLKS